MIIVNVEIHPHGRPEGSRQIMRMAIANVGPHRKLSDDVMADPTYYDYNAWLSKEDMAGDALGINNVQLDLKRPPDVTVMHRRDRGVTALIRAVLNEWDEEEEYRVEVTNDPDLYHIVEAVAA